MGNLSFLKKEAHQPFIIPPDLLIANELVYKPNGFICKNLEKEPESEEYGAVSFEMNNKRIKFRTGKITPTKTGQFVTFWKRIGKGPIQPYDFTDPIDFFVVSVRYGENFGQFVFPKAILWEKGILSKDGKGGKRAIRVYPPWDVTDSPLAKKTQAWQLTCFFEIKDSAPIDINRIQTLFHG